MILIAVSLVSALFANSIDAKGTVDQYIESTVTGSAVADAYVQSAYPNTPPGNQFNLYVGWDTINGDYNKGYTRTYIKFSLPTLPAYSVVDSVRLEIYHYAYGTTSGYGVTAYPLTCSFSEYEVTWNTKPTCIGSSAGSATIAASTGWKSINITNLGKQWFSNPSTNYGVAIYANNEAANGGVFYSKNCTTQCSDGTLRPRLIVDYHLNPPTSTFTPTKTLTPTPTRTQTPTPTPTSTSTPDPGYKPWTFMLYFAGDNNLYSYLDRAIEQMEAQPQNPNVNILVMFDGDRNKDSYILELQSGGQYIEGVNIWHKNELNLGDPDNLASFIIWARDHYPSEHTYLSIADHGRGTDGVAWDESSHNDHLTNPEIYSAFDIATNSGMWKLDVLQYDTCLMGMFENVYQVKDFVFYVVASENLGWSVFAYDTYTQALRDGSGEFAYEYDILIRSVNASTTPEQLANDIVTAYYNHPAIEYYPRTISAMDSSHADDVLNAIDLLAIELQGNLQDVKNYIQNARFAVQKFDSRDYYVIDQDDEYVDLYHLAYLLDKYIPDPEIKSAAQNLMANVEELVISEAHFSASWGWDEQHYWDLDNSHGISVFFPPKSGSSDYSEYIGDLTFVSTIDGLWDEFLMDYFGVMGLPPEDPTEPELPPNMPSSIMYYLPLILK